MRTWRVAVAVVVSALIGLCVASGRAVASGAPDQALPAAPALDPKAVEAWFDARVGPAMKRSGVPGVVVVVVRHDKVVLSKGYGIANLADGAPVRADRTLFDTASIGKSMTAVVVEQLIDEGRLNLDEDVNHYLKSAHVDGPKVTLRMLLGHRGGFDDDLTGLFVPFDGDTRVSRGELDRRLRPVFRPDTQTGYDNQGYGIVGLVLRDVTGKPFDELYREQLFAPAGMTSAVQGRPVDGMARLARCYVPRGPGKIRQCEYWLYRDALRGAGGVAATGDDMGRYMRLLLGGGVIDGKRVLSGRAFADLTNFADYRFNLGLPGLGRSFVEFETFRGVEYAHGGEMPGFNSILKLYPDADVGIFVSIMGGEVGSFDLKTSLLPQAIEDSDIDRPARKAFFSLGTINDAFAADFIPAVWPRRSEGPAAWVSTAPDRIEPYLGRYVITSATRTRSVGTRIMGLLGSVVVVQAGPSAVKVMGLGPYRHVGPNLYQDAKGARIAFLTSPAGRFMAIGLSPAQFRKTDWIDTPVWTLPLFALSFVVLLTSVVHLRPRASLRARTLGLFSLAGLALVMIGLLAECEWGVALAVVKGEVILPALWRIALHAGALLMAWAAATFILKRGSPISRLAYGHGLVIAVADVAVVVVLLFWRVLGAFPPWLSW